MEKSLLNSPKLEALLCRFLIPLVGCASSFGGGNKSREIENCTKIQFWMEIFSFMFRVWELVLSWTSWRVKSFFVGGLNFDFKHVMKMMIIYDIFAKDWHVKICFVCFAKEIYRFPFMGIYKFLYWHKYTFSEPKYRLSILL